MSSHKTNERGAVIIQVAIILIGLLAFSAIVLDYGVMWTSRGQAQNAADAGALTAAVHLMNNPTDTSGATVRAKAVANRNVVWGEAPLAANVLVQTGLPCPPATGAGTGCVKVDVLRGARDRNNVLHANYLPTFMAQLVGVSTQGAEATATAQITSGNAVKCIKPWIVADKWLDTDEHPAPGGWDRDDTFTPPADVYTIPGFTPEVDTGTLMPLKAGNIGTWSAGWAMEIDFGQSGSAPYKQNIEGCPTWVPTVAIWDGSWKCDAKGDTPSPEHGCVDVKTGMSQGPTSQGVNTLVGLDNGATWDPTGGPDNLGHVAGGCMANQTCLDVDGNHVDLSPRVVPIAAFDTTTYYNESAACSGTGCVARVTNLIGFFVMGMCSDLPTVPTWCGTASDAQKTVVGYLMRYPGQGLGTGGPSTSSFAQYVRLVR